MPLSKIQSDILRLLAAHHDPEINIAGNTLLKYSALQSSDYNDYFREREERVARAAAEDGAILKAEGLEVVWLRRDPAIYTAEVRGDSESTRLEWVADSDFRFFPTVPDELFGYMLHPIDLAANKVMAAAGRRKPADLVDLIAIHENILSLGAVIWAAVEKAPGFTPEGLIAEIRRNSNYRVEDLRSVPTVEPIDPKAFYSRLRRILNEAEAFVLRMPTEKVGLLFLQDGRVVQPDPDRLDQYVTHAGKRRGHWPGSTEIASAMLERYRKPPGP